MATNSSKSGGSTDEIGKENGKATFVPGDPGSTDFLSDRVQTAVETGKTPLETTQVLYLTVGRDGAWYEAPATADGVLNNGEVLIDPATGLTASTSNSFTINGLDITKTELTVRFVDGLTTHKLNLTGFGSDDKVVIDGATSADDWYGLGDELGAYVPTSDYTFSRGVGNSYFNNSQNVSANWYQYIYRSAGLQVNSGRTKVRGFYYASSFQYTRPNYRNSRGYTSDYGTNTLAIGLAGILNTQIQVIPPGP